MDRGAHGGAATAVQAGGRQNELRAGERSGVVTATAGDAGGDTVKQQARLVKRGTEKPVAAPQERKVGQSMQEAVKAKQAARAGQQQAAYGAWRALFGTGGAK